MSTNGDEKKLTNPWFEHDENASNDGKILKMFHDFRKLAKTMERSELESFVALGAYAVFWRIVEYLHGDTLAENDIDVIADDLRIDTKYVEMILKNFNLFHIENGNFISDRVLENLKRRNEKSKKSKKAIQFRWIKSKYEEQHKAIFGFEVILTEQETKKLYQICLTVPDLKDKLADIFYTAKQMKPFDNGVIANSSWLLKKDNLIDVLNGKYGALKHKKTEEEIAEEKQISLAENEDKKNLEYKIEGISSKAEAIDLIVNNGKIATMGGKAMVFPEFRKLMQKFDITDKEVIEKCQQ